MKIKIVFALSPDDEKRLDNCNDCHHDLCSEKCFEEDCPQFDKKEKILGYFEEFEYANKH